ncbi:MAG: hypothetical protein IKE55_07455 [Kiritimatiellae bacterium]|nr:hypothetical protein [Kiritimatiellia bacterium]
MRELSRLLGAKYDFVCGIGPDCGCAGHLIKGRLRRASYPLDWIGSWTLGMATLAKIVADDFAGFLKLENLRALPPPPPVDTPEGQLDDRHHDWVGDEATHLVLPHDFPAGRPLAEAFPAVRAKYDRRIARFYDTMRASRRTLFVYWTWRTHPEPDEILRAAEVFRAKFPGRRVDLLVMRHADAREVDARAIGDGVILVDAPIHPAGANPAFGDIEFNKRLFGAIRLRGKRLAVLRERLARLASKAKAAFIFDKAKRREYRRSQRKSAFHG